MNTERLTKIAEWLEAGAKHERITFDMNHGIRFDIVEPVRADCIQDCGTACCLAGAALQFFDPQSVRLRLFATGLTELEPDDAEIDWFFVFNEGADLLDLDSRTAHALFHPDIEHDGSLSDYNDPAWAARTIRHLIATGVANWEATREGGAA